MGGEEDEIVFSSGVPNAPVPTGAANLFPPVSYVHDGLIYDPAYIHKFKGPTLHTLMDRINALAIAVTDLQTVVSNIVDVEGPEVQKQVEKVVWKYTKQCCDQLGITVAEQGPLWDGTGVFEEGIDPYTCHITLG